MNLQESIGSLFELYGLRNAMYLRGDMRAMFLHDAIRTLGKRIRKEEPDKKVLAAALASVFSRTVAFADSFVDLPLVEALCEKYPPWGCAYCGYKPCGCAINRKSEIALASVADDQRAWTVAQWVGHLDGVYGINNRARGIHFVFGRLIEEVHETEGAHHFDEAYDQNVTLQDRRQRIAREFADVLAWIFTIAGMLELDLQTAIESRYGGVCYRCNERPCNCGSPFFYRERANPIDTLPVSRIAEK